MLSVSAAARSSRTTAGVPTLPYSTWYASRGGGASGRMVGSARIHAQPDRDGDGVLDDGDGSGVAGDNPCRGGDRAGCDDNCAEIVNPTQYDADGDGVGDCCEGLCLIDSAIDGCAECPSAEAVFVRPLAGAKTVLRRASSGGGERVKLGFETAAGAGAGAWGAATIRVRVSAGGHDVYAVSVPASRLRRSARRLLYRDAAAAERGLRRLVVRDAGDGRLTGTVVADGVAIAGSGSPGSGGGVVVEVGFDGDAHRGFAGCPKTSARGWRCKAR